MKSWKLWHARCVGEERVGAQVLGYIGLNDLECVKGNSLDVGASIVLCKEAHGQRNQSVPRTFCYYVLQINNVFILSYFYL